METRPMLRVDTSGVSELSGPRAPEGSDPQAEADDGAIFHELDHLRTLQSHIHEEHKKLEYGTIAFGVSEGSMDFHKISEEFASRQAAIGNMMTQLNELSTALSAFHARDIKPQAGSHA